MEAHDEEINALIARHATRIVPQMGRAMPHFLAYRRRQQRIRWASASAIAACLFVGVLLQFRPGPTTTVVVKAPPPATQARPIAMRYATVDSMPPLRVLHKTVLQRVYRYDPQQQARVAMYIPCDKVVLLPIRTRGQE
jgi:hypothetical protein